MNALRVAIPVFNGRISPLLDVAASFLYADIEDGEILERSFIRLAENASLLRIRFLKERGVQLVICSAVSRECACAVARMGITVLPGIIGEADDVLEAFARNSLSSERFAMPGCCGRSRLRRGSCASQKEHDNSPLEKRSIEK
ncbi:MAG: NifB/NifX family molybdenum-iron cluster-binding protein [Spirochaetota bacterium]